MPAEAPLSDINTGLLVLFTQRYSKKNFKNDKLIIDLRLRLHKPMLHANLKRTSNETLPC